MSAIDVLMDKTACKAFADVLELASDAFGNRVCNDWCLENTPENMSFVKGMIADGDYPNDDPTISDDGNLIYVMDWQVLDYLRRLIMRMGGIEEEAEDES